VGDAEGDVALVEQGRAGEREVQVAPRVGDAADAVQLLLEVLCDEAARAHAVDVDPPGAGHEVDHLLQHRDVDLQGGVLHRPRVGERDLLDHLGQIVGFADVAADRLLGGRRVGGPAGLGGEREAQLGVPPEAHRAAEPDHGGLRGAGAFGEVGDREVRRGGRLVDDHLRDAAFGR
jgi:hypothetical protein